MNLRKIVCFGNSSASNYSIALSQGVKRFYPDLGCEIINAGVDGETPDIGFARIQEVCALRPDIVLLSFCVDVQTSDRLLSEYKSNLGRIIDVLEKFEFKTLLSTNYPARTSLDSVRNKNIKACNQIVKELASKRCLRLIDIYSIWLRDMKPHAKGLADEINLNNKGSELCAKTIVSILGRPKVTILWQYNGNPCSCNYACPYCWYPTQKQSGNHFNYTIDIWRDAFKSTFGQQELTFYLAHGEPMLGARFYDALDMIGEEKNWTVRMTSNVSVPLDRLVQTRVAKEARLNINASFHPTMVDREKFLEQILFLRQNDIEVPVVYTMYPPFLDRFLEDFECFNKYNFLVHVRRFSGVYDNKKYPYAYTDEQRRFIAKYCDDATIKYMLNMEPSYGKPSWTGVDFVLVDNCGNVGYCDDYYPLNDGLGNIFEGTCRMLSFPEPFPGKHISDGTVDGVANFVELNYPQLNDNNVITFARAGGVYRDKKTIRYANMNTNFKDSRIRAEYGFPASSFKDSFFVVLKSKRKMMYRLNDAFSFLMPEMFKQAICYVGNRVKWRFDGCRDGVLAFVENRFWRLKKVLEWFY